MAEAVHGIGPSAGFAPVVGQLKFCDGQEPGPEIGADFISGQFGESHQKGILSQVLGVFEMVDPGGEISAYQQAVFPDDQAEAIAVPLENLTDDEIRIKTVCG